MVETAKPLPFRQADSQGNRTSWGQGLDRRQVGLYVGLAVLAGFGLGFATARFIVSSPPRPEQPSAVSGSLGNAVASQYHKVSRIIRGDTIEVDGVGQVRLLGVESPDGKTPTVLYAPHGRNVLAFVEKSLLNEEVRVEFDSTMATSDGASGPAGRAAYIYTRDGGLFNKEIIRQGLAFFRTSDEGELVDKLRAAERDAIQSMRGVWGLSEPAKTMPGATNPPVLADSKARKVSPLLPSELEARLDPAVTHSVERIVLVSSADRMYHKEGCEYLSKKNQVLPLSRAKSEGYGACGRCFASTVLKAP